MFSYWNHVWKIINQINIFSYWNHFWNQIEEKKEERNVPELNNNEDSLSTFAKLIEQRIDNLPSCTTHTNITEYTYTLIDGILVKIYIGKEKNKNTYTYHITFPSYYITSDDEEQEDRDIYSYWKDECKNVLSILKDIEEVKTYYKFMEHELLSPQQIEYAKMQRTYFPMPPDKKCSVCYESTCQYTICNHLICFRCRFTCIESGNFMCPICRAKELRFFPSELE
jgi:hypothetical protein